jgi:DNA topoisomerase I
MSYSTLILRVAARYKSKKELDSGNVVYEYSDRQIARRNKEKAERLEELRHKIDDLKAQAKKDLKSEDPETFLAALATNLMCLTGERVGNDESKEESGHVGVTGWMKKHLTFSDGKASFKYVGKSGVKQKKTVDDAEVVKALKKTYEDPAEDLFTFNDVKVGASKVNAYLKKFDVTAKDIRGLNSNLVILDNLKAIRKKNGKLPEDKKEREKQLKDEFKEALEETAKQVGGHEPQTLRKMYLVPDLEESFLKDGTIIEKLSE